MNSNKVVMLGDSSVGKSSILEYFRYQRFIPNIESTVGCEFYAKQIKINNEIIKLLMWDTAGQEVFRCFTSNFLRKAKIIVIVYDISNIESFENIRIWLIESNVVPDAKIVISGNKNDLNSKVRCLKYIDKLKKEFSNKEIYYFGDVSAKTGKNIEELFLYIGNIILRSKSNKSSNIENQAIVDLNNKNKKTCSC